MNFDFLSPDKQQLEPVEVTTDRENDAEILKFLEENKVFKTSPIEGEMKFDEETSVHYYHLKQESPKALCFAFHGYQGCLEGECSSIFNVLGENGFEVVGYDAELHGKTCKKRRKDGRPIGRVKNYMNLLNQAVKFMKFFLEKEGERLKDLSIFLWGASMGGGTVLGVNILLNQNKEVELKNRITGMFLSAPMVIVDPNMSDTLVCLVKCLALFIPCLEIKATPQKCVTFDEMHEKFVSNPLSSCGKMHLGTAMQLLKFGDFVKDNLSKIDIPYFLAHGTKDTMVKIEGSDLLWNKTNQLKDKTYVKFKDALHALDWDVTGRKLCNFAKEWMLTRIK